MTYLGNPSKAMFDNVECSFMNLLKSTNTCVGGCIMCAFNVWSILGIIIWNMSPTTPFTSPSC